MLAGSVAAGVHSAPRATQDLDIVIDPTAETLHSLVVHLRGASMYVSDESAREALASRDQFNAIDLTSSWKVDLIVRKNRPFSVAEFSRREQIRLLGVDVSVASAEDCALAKLEWASASGSARQIQDVERLLGERRNELDIAYLQQWANELGLAEALDLSLTRALRDS